MKSNNFSLHSTLSARVDGLNSLHRTQKNKLRAATNRDPDRKLRPGILIYPTNTGPKRTLAKEGDKHMGWKLEPARMGVFMPVVSLDVEDYRIKAIGRGEGWNVEPR